MAGKQLQTIDVIWTANERGWVYRDGEPVGYFCDPKLSFQFVEMLNAMDSGKILEGIEV